MTRDAAVETRRWNYHRRLGVPVAHEVGVEGWVVGAWHDVGHGRLYSFCLMVGFIVAQLLLEGVLIYMVGGLVGIEDVVTFNFVGYA